MERTLVLIKPDGVQRGLTGEILRRLEQLGLKIIGLKMVWPSRADADRHYVMTEEWVKGVYEKAKKKYGELGQKFPYADAPSYGAVIKKGLVEFLSSGPVVIAMMEGEQSVALVRKIVGATEPASALPGTIRGDLSPDSYPLANAQDRPLRNLIHASGDVSEAKREIALWFSPKELHVYEHALGGLLYGEKYFKK